ncbi:protein-tyrosine phosphatase family protein [Gemmata sp.]|uniref:protein-tyrosine phosphatase family protein n=1 Tax=Gemmata sp. TaxID=1914242 RepID=UPI003F6F41B4
MYRVTQVLSVGPFATVERAEMLRAAGVTHVLNVSGGPSHLTADAHGFERVSWIALDDFERLPSHTAVELLDTLHGMASQPGAHVYVHCVAGHLRSPTVLWLYLIAMGLSAEDARDLIEERAPSAVPGHHRMVDHQHVLLAHKHGLANFFPHPRPEIIVPFQLPGV